MEPSGDALTQWAKTSQAGILSNSLIKQFPKSSELTAAVNISVDECQWQQLQQDSKQQTSKQQDSKQ